MANRYESSDEDSAEEFVQGNRMSRVSESQSRNVAMRDNRTRQSNVTRSRDSNMSSPKGEAREVPSKHVFKPRNLGSEERSSTLRDNAMKAKASNLWAETRPNKVYESDDDNDDDEDNYIPRRQQRKPAKSAGTKDAWSNAKPQADLRDSEEYASDQRYEDHRRATSKMKAKAKSNESTQRSTDRYDDRYEDRLNNRYHDGGPRGGETGYTNDRRTRDKDYERDHTNARNPKARAAAAATPERYSEESYERDSKAGSSQRYSKQESGTAYNTRAYKDADFEIEGDMSEEDADRDSKDESQMRKSYSLLAIKGGSRNSLEIPDMEEVSPNPTSKGSAPTSAFALRYSAQGRAKWADTGSKEKDSAPQPDFEIDDDEEEAFAVDKKTEKYYDDDDPEDTEANRTVVPYVLKAHETGYRSELVQCTVIRDRASIANKLNPIYEMSLDVNSRKLITAVKRTMNRTSNYHFFDMTRGQLGSKLSKKNGNYLGKLRAKNYSRTDYVLVTQNSDKEEVAGIQFEKLGFLNQLKDGSQPRKMTAIVPHLDSNKVPIPNPLGNNDTGSMIDMLRDGTGGNRILSFESKDPVFDNGNYRLNFNGRVSVPSVKNFQLVPRDDIDNIILQFGKVGEDRFHLDFKSPLNAFQALALAICQFNL